jgi:hypothetical protein
MEHNYKAILSAAMALAMLTASDVFRDSAPASHGCQKSNSGCSTGKSAEMAALPGNSLADIKYNIMKREYSISMDRKKGILQSPNRRHNLRAYYQPGKLALQNRVDSAGHNFRFELVNEGIFADGHKVYVPQPDASTDNKDDRLAINHKGFTEEFINNEDGVRQNFIVKHVPEGTKQLQVRLTAKGVKIHKGEGNELYFLIQNTKGKSENRLVYSDLKCWDADNQPLTASLSHVKNRIEINVNVENAAYPVTIDPIITNGSPANANKTLEINQGNAWVGFSVSSAGDVNGDGYSEVIVGAPKDDNGQADEGAAFVYPGTANGLSLAAVTLQGNQAGAQAGYSVSSAGDINGDGFSDVLVGAPYYDYTENNEGAVFVYMGASKGLDDNPVTTLTSHQADAGLGISVALAGDVNMDGYSDILVGAYAYDNGQVDEGAAFLCHGAQDGLQISTIETLECNQAGAMMGYAVAGAGDINADGAGDVIVGARFYHDGEVNEGAVFVYQGAAAGPVNAIQLLQINQTDARMGHSLSTAGDVNGDGYADIIIGAYMYDEGQTNEGVAFIHHGSQNGVQAVPAITLEGNQTEAQFGWAVASAGDVNGDGYGDIIVGARFYDSGQANEGAAFVYHGSDDGIHALADSKLESNQGEAWMGSAVASAGDVNGDGYSDIVIGSYAYDSGQNDEGIALVYHGMASSVGTYCKPIELNQAEAYVGYSVSNAGDVNGDGLDDVIVGAPYVDSGEPNEGMAVIYYGNTATGVGSHESLQCNQAGANFGHSVSGAGDVNGDGYDDVIVGAISFDKGVVQGAAFIFYGGAGGINPNPAIVLDNNLVGTEYGASVSSAGDINRDGYSDVLVGAPNYSKSNPAVAKAGAVYIYLGSFNGIVASGTMVTADLENSHLGIEVANAGDVNGDGYGDIIAGAHMYSTGQANEGAAMVYYGSPAGIPTNSPMNTLLQSNQADAFLGSSVSGAGDVNGDGFSDVIVGAYKYDNGENNEGAAMVYYGSASGLGFQNPSILEINQPAAYFGYSVESAGDVNGDGYSDVIVGAPYYLNANNSAGGARVFHGSPGGINPISSFSVVTGQDFAMLGSSVSGAGDVNGDGYSDIVIGVPHYDVVQPAIKNTGRALVYFGNNQGTGNVRRNNIRLYNSDLVTNMTAAQSNNTEVGIGLYSTSFLGRVKGRMVWDFAEFGQSFPKVGNYPITTYTAYDGAQNSWSDVDGGVLKDIINKPWPANRLRVRIQYKRSTALTGQIFGPWRYVQDYILAVPVNPAPREVVSDIISEEIFPETTEPVVLYPNPVSDKLFIDAPGQIRSVHLLTANGKTVYQSSTGEREMNVQSLASGTYIMIITHADGTRTTRKIAIKR